MLEVDSMENPMDPGRSRAFAGRRVAITGASGSLGLALLRAFHGCGASLVALTTRVEPLELSTSDGTPIALEQVTWSCGHEADLRELFSHIDILVINHWVNVHGDRSATGLERHRVHWLSGDHEIGSIPGCWNHLVAVQDPAKAVGSTLLHWTLGGPWFREQRTMGEGLAAEWFAARDDAFRLWD